MRTSRSVTLRRVNCVRPTLALHIDSEEYRDILVAALKDGFEHESRSAGYVGDSGISRSSLEEAAKRVGGQNHRMIVVEVYRLAGR